MIPPVFYAFLASDRHYHSKSAWEKVVRAGIPVGDKGKWRHIDLTPKGATYDFTVRKFIDVTGRGDKEWTVSAALFQIIDINLSRLVHHRMTLDSTIRPYFFELADGDPKTFDRFTTLAGLLFEASLKPTIRADFKAYKINVPHHLRSVFGAPPATTASTPPYTISPIGKNLATIVASNDWIERITVTDSIRDAFEDFIDAIDNEHTEHLATIDEIYFAPLRAEFNALIKWVAS